LDEEKSGGSDTSHGVPVCEKRGAIAQLGERLPCTQEVDGSIPSGSTIYSVHMNKNKYFGSRVLIFVRCY
jgi:hypothetical protein